MSVCAKRDAEGTGETEISQLQVALAVDEQVLGLQIAVEDTMAVAVADALTQLAHELLDNSIAHSQPVQLSAGALRQSLATSSIRDREGFHVFLQIQVEELEHEVELVAIGVDNVEELNDVGVTHLLQQGDLADGGGGNAFILGLETDLLQCHNATSVL